VNSKVRSKRSRLFESGIGVAIEIPDVAMETAESSRHPLLTCISDLSTGFSFEYFFSISGEYDTVFNGCLDDSAVSMATSGISIATPIPDSNSLERMQLEIDKLVGFKFE
jgi:hypothetical protein